MREPSRFQLWYGRDEPPAAMRQLRAGPLTALLDGIDLRYVRVGGVEVVRRLFVAVRDAAWGTIPPRVEGLEVEQGEGKFLVSFEAFHEAGELRFRWRGEYAGAGDGSLVCRMDGRAESDFRYNRIGFCILHPRENAGRRYRARTPEGELEGTLPDEIGPQRIEDGKLHPLFPSFRRLEVEVADGLWAEFELEGDLFEMEDQRNWTDASFKTYSTPLTLGWPHDAKAGQEIVQRVALAHSGEPPRPRRAAGGAVEIQLGKPTSSLLPSLGLGQASHGRALSEREAELLTELRADHLRADLDLGGEWRGELERASEAAIATGAALELALLLGGDPEAELAAVADALPLAQAGVARFLVLRPGQEVTDGSAARLARARLEPARPGAAFACGTNQWFTELNRERPALDGADAVVYSLCATVHADDDVSVRETPAAQGDTVRSARAIAGSLPVVVSPITFRPRSWPFGELEGFRGLPYQVDPRQCALFGAAWTVASAKHVTEAGVSSVTYFETTGWRGVMETEAGSLDPERFPSRPGAVFPLYHVLADLGGWRTDVAVLVPASSSEPLAVEALAVASSGGVHALLANLTPEVQRCRVSGLPAGTVSLRVLDEGSALRAGDDPLAFRAEREERKAADGVLELELAPYAVARMDT